MKCMLQLYQYMLHDVTICLQVDSEKKAADVKTLKYARQTDVPVEQIIRHVIQRGVDPPNSESEILSTLLVYIC